MEDSEALRDPEQDEDEVEEDGPEGRDHFGPEEGEVCRDELGGEPVDLVAALHDGVPVCGDDPDPRQVTDVVILRWAHVGLDGGAGSGGIHIVDIIAIHLVVFQIVKELP